MTAAIFDVPNARCPSAPVPTSFATRFLAFNAALVLAALALSSAPLRAEETPGTVEPLDTDLAPEAGGAEAQSSLAPFVQAVQQGDWGSARVLADELRDRFEGTARFDFYYALLLLQENRTQQAIFALERVLAFAPNQHRARLELGRAYFANNNLARSRTEFERVLATDPPANVRNNINNYLDRIATAEQARSRQFNLYAGMEAGWDSNINQGSNLEGELASNLLNLTSLSDDSKAVGSSYGRLNFGGQWTRPTSLNSGHSYGLQGQTVLFPGHGEYDRTGLHGHYQVSKVTDQWRGRLSLGSGYTWVDAEPWQFSLGGGGQLTRPVWGPLQAGLAAQSHLGFAQSGDRANSVNDAVGLLFTAEEQARTHRFSSQYIQYSLSGTDDGHLEWRGVSNRYTLDWQWPLRLGTSVALRHDWRYYRADDLLFTDGDSTDRKRRQDHLLTGNAALTWQPEPWLLSRTGLRLEWLDSNINAYSRDQWVISQALTLQF